MSSLYALVVEDDQDLSTIFAEALRAAGFEAEVIHEGQAAIEKLRTSTPDVVVLDMHLPKVPGTEILEQMRADARLDDTRVVVATADARLAEQLHDKADLVLVKPISFGQLRDLASRLGSLVS